MDTILLGLDGVICYIDDNYPIHPRGEFEDSVGLKEHGIPLKKSKCQYELPSMEYLGHRVNAKGIHATDGSQFWKPQLQRMVQELGMLNLFHSESLYYSASPEPAPL